MPSRTTPVTAPAEEPLTLAEAKAHLRVDASNEDDLIAALIVAARELAETRQRRALVTQTWDLTLDRWPYGGGYYDRAIRQMGPGSPLWLPNTGQLPIELPRPPLQSVTSIAYVDPEGNSQTLDPSAYVVSTGTPGRIAPAYGLTWPSIRNQIDAVTIRYVAGYGAASAVPKATKQAILLLVGHLYENREAVAVNVGANILELPMGVEALLMADAFGSYA